MKQNDAPRMRLGQDIVLGLIFIGIGLTAGFVAIGYPMGTSGRMGPGYFPVIISTLIAGVGLVLLLRARFEASEPIPAVPWRPLIILPAALVLFGLLLDNLGLPLAVLMLTMCCGATSHKFRLSVKAVAAAVAFSAFCAVIFGKLLGLPIPLLGSWLQGLGGF